VDGITLGGWRYLVSLLEGPLVRTRLFLLLSAALVVWLSGSPLSARAQAPKPRELSPDEVIGRMKADDPNVPARIDQAMEDLRAKAMQLRKGLEETEQRLRKLDELKRAYLARRQKEVDPRTVPTMLDEILHRLERIERRLDQLEARVPGPTFQYKNK
jgi:hypothetical protein